MTEAPPAAPQPDPTVRRRYAREAHRQIWAPMILAACGLALFLVILVIVFNRGLERQFSIVSDVMLVCFTLLPCIVGALVLFLLMAFAAFGVYAANGRVPHLFARARRGLDAALGKVNRAAGVAAKPVVGLNARLTYWGRYFDRITAPFTATSANKESDSDE
ncbi:MAG: hypothetical protein M5R40_13225 [Anaerolineae bacterium]|nr:hypothetical protein [Anaerolineae bacterium]